ncbi:ketosteroid isomerase-like protein [Paenibacillus polymyxa]|uniref:YybH family protein n=1 Tax=Paenibacillus polymyxa TaxID=1406 RepID=UPI0027916ADD|nr:nuclear transport factor 2 family protein [Paenibacillus polymyxa]MDQ0045801.1 ketosteroid isomerase-like protein [Paenibacillus polymyxa]
MNTQIKKEILEAVFEIERANNERWNQGDCHGYLDSYSEDISYFDPITEKLIVGNAAVRKHILSNYKNPNIIRSEYLNPDVTVSEAGDLAVLSYNLRNFVKGENGEETLFAFWNSTAVFRQIDGEWRTVNAHWSFVQHPGIVSGPNSF